MELKVVILISVIVALLFSPASFLHGRESQSLARTPKRKAFRIVLNLFLAAVWLLIAVYVSQVTWLMAFAVVFTTGNLVEVAGRLSVRR